MAEGPGDSAQRPLELILARNFITNISTPAFIVDEGGLLVFYNEAAGELLALPFEEAGRMGPEEWGSAFGPFAEDGSHIPYDELPLTVSLREGRAAHSDFRIRSAKGTDHDIAVSALPIVSAEGATGAIAFFWPRGEVDAGLETAAREDAR